MTFRIRGLPADQFAELFDLSDAELASRGAVRRVADAPYPCRVSLTDAKEGDELVLVNYEHHPVDSPYRMRYAIFVRQGEETYDEIDEVPEQLRKRTLAVRAFDEVFFPSDFWKGVRCLDQKREPAAQGEDRVVVHDLPRDGVQAHEGEPGLFP